MSNFEEKLATVYIMANKPRGRIYIGVTEQVWACVAKHRERASAGNGRQFGLSRLVWYEHHISLQIAIWRQERLRSWHRDLKIFLIESRNPGWLDLFGQLDPELRSGGSGPRRP